MSALSPEKMMGLLKEEVYLDGDGRLFLSQRLNMKDAKNLQMGVFGADGKKP